MNARASSVQPTVDEIIALLKKTNLPTVVCEGSDDLIVYRRFEEHLEDLGVSILPAGGRKNVLQIFDRRAEIPSSVRLAFVADRDTWVNSSVPAAYVVPALCLTAGYSIENDVIADGNLEGLLIGSELASYRAELGDFLDWYALALDRHLKDPSSSIALHPDHVLNPVERGALMALSLGESYPSGLRQSLAVDYRSTVRGKSLLSLLIRNTNTRTGLPKHTDKALLEIVAMRPGALLKKLGNDLRSGLSI